MKTNSYLAGAVCVFAICIAAGFLWLLVLPRPQPPVPIGPRPFDTLHPHTQAAFRRLGITPERVTQGLGFAPSSAGIHGADGTVGGRLYCAAFDLSVSDLTPAQTRALLHTLRGAGFACWLRVPGVSFPVTTALGVEAGPHLHGVDPFVPHKRRLEMQIRDYTAGNNGIEIGRYAHRPDPAAADPQTLAERHLLHQGSVRWQFQPSASPSAIHKSIESSSNEVFSILFWNRRISRLHCLLFVALSGSVTKRRAGRQ